MAHSPEIKVPVTLDVNPLNVASAVVTAKNLYTAADLASEYFYSYFGDGVEWQLTGSHGKWNPDSRQWAVEVVAVSRGDK